jgi:hypothetical protein
MDDDVPKEGELFDLNKKYTGPSRATLVSGERMKARMPIGAIVVVLFFIGILFLARGGFGGSASKEAIATYKQGTQSTFNTMKSQFPYLLNVLCEGSDPTKEDCINFVGTFRPDKENPNYAISMVANDKVEGISIADMTTLKDDIKVLVDAKRSVLVYRKPFTFLIDSVTVPRVGEELKVKIKCKEDSKEIIVCEPLL